MPIFPCASMKNLENFFNFVTAKETRYCGAIVATATAIFASAYFGWAYVKRACKHKNGVDRVMKRSMSIGALHGGRLALERMIEYHNARANGTSLEAADSELRYRLTKKQPDFKKLQSTVAKLEMSGKEAEAVGILETALKTAQKEGKAHEAYETEMLLVEMRIYKGDFKKALDCECLSHEEISDARRPLYKAIIHIMLDHPRDQALACWEEFKDIRMDFQSPPSLEESELRKVISDFSEFEKVVKLIKDDIHRAHRN